MSSTHSTGRVQRPAGTSFPCFSCGGPVTKRHPAWNSFWFHALCLAGAAILCAISIEAARAVWLALIVFVAVCSVIVGIQWLLGKTEDSRAPESTQPTATEQERQERLSALASIPDAELRGHWKCERCGREYQF